MVALLMFYKTAMILNAGHFLDYIHRMFTVFIVGRQKQLVH